MLIQLLATYICIYYTTKIILSLFLQEYSCKINKLKYSQVSQHVTSYNNS